MTDFSFMKGYISASIFFVCATGVAIIIKSVDAISSDAFSIATSSIPVETYEDSDVPPLRPTPIT